MHMGLSSKKVSRDGVDWSETLLQQAHTLNQLPKPCIGRRQLLQNQHQTEPLKCPRCDSTNTKFCYYNNYNKSQPRHFCKSCKRHWTKGGTLRNVPVGGGRKNKRLKTSKTRSKTATTATASNTTPSNIIHRIQQNQLPTLGDHQKSALISQNSAVLQHDSISNGVIMRSTSLSHLQARELSFPYSNSSSFDSISNSFQSSNVYNYSSGETAEDINSIIMPTTSTHHQLQLPNACHGIDYLNCDDINNFMSSSELNVPWDDFELKP